MKLLEHQGKELFRRYGITIPLFELLNDSSKVPKLAFPLVLKSQVSSGDRMKKGGIRFVEHKGEFGNLLIYLPKNLFNSSKNYM
jgi:succinyl-CoA synthetase beta subunit